MTKRQEVYYECNGCGVKSNDPEIAAKIEDSVGNGFVTLEATNLITGDDLIPEDVHICSKCWGLVQIIIDRGQQIGRKVVILPVTPPAALTAPPCTCDPFEPGSSYGCPVHDPYAMT